MRIFTLQKGFITEISQYFSLKYKFFNNAVYQNYDYICKRIVTEALTSFYRYNKPSRSLTGRFILHTFKHESTKLWIWTWRQSRRRVVNGEEKREWVGSAFTFTTRLIESWLKIHLIKDVRHYVYCPVKRANRAWSSAIAGESPECLANAGHGQSSVLY